MKITTDIAEAARIIAAGRVVGVPTGTSYALAVDALQGHALQRVRNLKKRPTEKTFTVCLIPALWEKYLRLTAKEEALLKTAHQEAVPLTLLVQPQESLMHLSRDGRIGVRVLDHPVVLHLAEVAGVPLTATSANISGSSDSYTAHRVLETFPGLVDPTQPNISRAGPTTHDLSLGCVLDGGQLPPTLPSTVAFLNEKGQPTVVRQGTLSAADLQRLVEGR